MSAPLMSMDDKELLKIAVNADALLSLESLRQEGLIEGGPPIVVERCQHVIAAARERGLDWTAEDVKQTALGLIAAWNARQS